MTNMMVAPAIQPNMMPAYKMTYKFLALYYNSYPVFPQFYQARLLHHHSLQDINIMYFMLM